MNMESSLQLANQVTEKSIENYAAQEISLQDILQILSRHLETEKNFLDVYLRYRGSLLYLTINTYYDFEKNVSLLDQVSIAKGDFLD